MSESQKQAIELIQKMIDGDRLYLIDQQQATKALALLESEPEPSEVDIPLPSTDYLRTCASFCKEHIGFDDFMKRTAYDLERAAKKIDNQQSENERLKARVELQSNTIRYCKDAGWGEFYAKKLQQLATELAKAKKENEKLKAIIFVEAEHCTAFVGADELGNYKCAVARYFLSVGDIIPELKQLAEEVGYDCENQKWK